MLKKFNVLLCFLFLGIGLFGVVCLVKKDNKCTYLSIGDYVSKNQYQNNKIVVSFVDGLEKYLKDNKIVQRSNNEYVTNNMTSKKLLEMIENGVYSNKDSNLLNEIESSKYITITLGVNDIINNIKYDKINDNLIYNKDLLVEKVNIFKHNYYNIINGIKEVNDSVNIILVGSYFVYDDFIEDTLNNAIKEVADYNDLIYIHISDLDNMCLNDNKLYLNSNGQEVLFNKIVTKIKEID